MTVESLLPIDTVVRRFARDLATIDRLLDLLFSVEASYRFTNRLGEAVILLPEEDFHRIREAIGTPVLDEGHESTHASS